MKVYRNTSLKKYNTFGFDHKANNLISVKTEKEAVSLFSGDFSLKKPLIIIGSGSNILFIRDFDGTIITSDIKGIRVSEKSENSVVVSAGSGIVWDDLVAWCVNKGFTGIENLSLIPGKTGAAPVQNIGAYGVEAKDFIIKVKAVSTFDGTVRYFTKNECEFAYRDSVFKKYEKNKYLVTRVWFRLSTRGEFRLNYGALSEEVLKLGQPTAEKVRAAVIKIRSEKLPDPSVLGNAGSFFKNPVIKENLADELVLKFPGMVQYPDKPGMKKLAAGWMIEQCGWKGKRIGDAGVHDKQALVIVNYGKATGKEILELSDKIRESVYNKFGVILEYEVEVI